MFVVISFTKKNVSFHSVLDLVKHGNTVTITKDKVGFYFGVVVCMVSLRLSLAPPECLLDSKTSRVIASMAFHYPTSNSFLHT